MRFAETLTPSRASLPVLQVSAADDADADAADRLRNELQLHPLKPPTAGRQGACHRLVRARRRLDTPSLGRHWPKAMRGPG
jgi:hypothetical protein